MVNFQRHVLSNGLTVLVHEDPTTPIATVNTLYKVGARDERVEKTGFAHLFEHFMFEGSVNVPEFDTELQIAGGENNAFTSSDITNYYDNLPAKNLETAFWLESDRMLSLDFNEESLNTQKRVVMEEFKEHYINMPYGDWWHKMNALAYTTHPYQWPVIGKELSHVEAVTMDEFREFFFKYYRPNNAILVVAGGVKSEAVFKLAEKWYGNIERGVNIERNLPKEPVQPAKRELSMQADVPVPALYKAWKMCARGHADYYATDLLRELLSGGESSRMYVELVKEQKVFSSISMYLTDTLDEGLLFVEGKVNNGHSLQQAEAALQHTVQKLADEKISEQELGKMKNKIEAYITFGETNVSHRAMNLAYFEMMGDAAALNQEQQRYGDVTADQLQSLAANIFREENSNVIYYSPRQ